jgi:hypothetical protein
MTAKWSGAIVTLASGWTAKGSEGVSRSLCRSRKSLKTDRLHLLDAHVGSVEGIAFRGIVDAHPEYS